VFQGRVARAKEPTLTTLPVRRTVRPTFSPSLTELTRGVGCVDGSRATKAAKGKRVHRSTFSLLGWTQRRSEACLVILRGATTMLHIADSPRYNVYLLPLCQPAPELRTGQMSKPRLCQLLQNVPSLLASAGLFIAWSRPPRFMCYTPIAEFAYPRRCPERPAFL
jgi:hypothetical protein